jgi:hypothetical protein
MTVKEPRNNECSVESAEQSDISGAREEFGIEVNRKHRSRCKKNNLNVPESRCERVRPDEEMRFHLIK